MTRRVFLGLDCGTGSTKALLLDADSGATVTVGRADHELIERPDGTREQRPEWWTEAATEAIRGALAGAARAEGRAGDVEVAGIGVSGQQHGLVALDAADTPLRPAKLWNDTTTAAQCAALTERLGGREHVLRLTGNAFLPGYTAPKVAWLREHEPNAYAAATRFCLPHDYLDLWLSGTFATEPGDASGTAYFDSRERRYSEPVLAALDEGRDWDATLPPVVASRSVLGQLREEVAAPTGLAAGTPVSAGGGDNMCSAIGVGAHEPGRLVVSLGTSGTAFTYAAEPAADPLGEAAAFCDSTGGWLPLICTLNCTGATDWIRRLLGLDHDGFEAALREAGAGAAGLTFLPYLDGERTPDLPSASGTFAGLRSSHRPADLVRAVAEGVTFGLRYGVEALRRAGVTPREVTLVGGGATSDAWAQLCADVLGLPLRRPAVVEAAARGAALQARWVVDGVAPETDGASGDRFEPAPSQALIDAAGRQDASRRLAVEGRL